MLKLQKYCQIRLLWARKPPRGEFFFIKFEEKNFDPQPTQTQKNFWNHFIRKYLIRHQVSILVQYLLQYRVKIYYYSDFNSEIRYFECSLAPPSAWIEKILASSASLGPKTPRGEFLSRKKNFWTQTHAKFEKLLTTFILRKVASYPQSIFDLLISKKWSISNTMTFNSYRFRCPIIAKPKNGSCLSSFSVHIVILTYRIEKNICFDIWGHLIPTGFGSLLWPKQDTITERGLI